MKKLITFLGTLLLGSSMAFATACTNLTTVSSTGLVDSDSMTWASATITASIVYPQQIFSFSALSCAGGTFLQQYTATANGSGAFSISLPANTSISPLGSQWAITVCPYAVAGCYTYTITTTGSTQDITTALNAVLPGPRFYPQQANYGYSTLELTTTVPVGTLFFNTTSLVEQVWNGTSWYNMVTSGTGNFITPYANIQEDFCGNTPGTSTTIGQYGWDSTAVVAGTNPVAAVASVSGHPCLITLTTDTTATHGVYVSLGHAVGVLFPGNTINWQSEHIAEINQVATGSYRIGFGTVDSATAIPTNGIYFRFLQGTDTYINACSDSAGTETCTATTIAPTAADYVDFFMSSTTAGKVTFTVKDVTTPATSTVTLCASGCTAVATLPTVVLSPMFSIVETGASVADVLTADYFSYQQILSR